MVEYRRAEAEHADELLANMRDEDRAECEAAGYTPRAALLGSMGRSLERVAVYADGDLLGIYGVAPVEKGAPEYPAHYIWFLSTHAVRKHPVDFVKATRRVVPQLAREYGRLVNFVDARYEAALRWLSRVGFTLSTKEYVGPRGHRFIAVRYAAPQEV